LSLDRRGPNTEASVEAVTVSLGETETTALLERVPAAYRTQINDSLLAALGMALTRWTGSSAHLVDLEGHGREDLVEGLDLSRTVGWFTSIFPVLLDVEGLSNPGIAIRRVKERLRSMPNRGAGFGPLRYLRTGSSSPLGDLPRADLLFNYLGQLDQAIPESSPFTVAREAQGSDVSLQAHRRYALDVNASVSGGRLRFTWSFSRNLHRRETVERLASALLDQLERLIEHCLTAEAGGFSPSDFPLAGLDQDALDRLTNGDREIVDIYPLSPMQEGMLIHTLLDPEMYFEQVSCNLLGDLDTEAFERAWRQVMGRHAVLRTAFSWEGLDRPLQLVRSSVELPIERFDWRSVTAAELPSRLEELRRVDSARGFDIARSPLTRLLLVRTAERSHFFIWSHHHLILDGWCMTLLLDEVFAIYGAISKGLELRLPQPRPFRDFITWLGRQDLAAAERFWRANLAGFEAPTPLGLERALARSASGQRELEVRLSAESSDSLRSLARRRHLTLNTFVQGAWSLLLSRYSGEREIVFGAIVAGRPPELPEVESMVGMFVNTLPARVKVDPAARLLAWLADLQERQVEFRQFEYTPLQAIQAWSELPRGTQLFETILGFENQPAGESVDTGVEELRLTEVTFSERTNLPISVAALPEARLALLVAYDRARLDDVGMHRFANHFRALLEELSVGSDRRLDDLELLAPCERQQLLHEWCVEVEAEPEDLDFDQIFSARVCLHPDKIASVVGSRSLTYLELDRRAARLAALLAARGVGPDSLVALFAERGLELLVAILAVFKAGAAYLPLDPYHPVGRVVSLLADAEVRWVIAAADLQAKLKAGLVELGSAAPPELLGLEWALSEDVPPSRDRSRRIDPGHLAYVIYTSGSTGRPKGAMVIRRGMVNHLMAKIEALRLDANDAVAQTASQCFDISVWQFLAPLFVGARVEIFEDEVTQDPARLLDGVEERSATVLESVPSLLRYLVDEANQRGETRPSLPSLRWMIPTGEALPPDLCADWFAQYPEVPLLNAYGPTECSDDVTHHRLDGPLAVEERNVPIGRPVRRTRIYLLDASLRPVPPGVAGELCVGGVGVGRGYLGDPRRTAEVFVPDPEAAVWGARLYRTGDLGRFLPGGEIEFLGRRDAQVKIRGFRIELGEIEAVLGQHPDVREAAVVAYGDRRGRQSLVGYVVSVGGDRSRDLKFYLAERLPDYMIPALVFLPVLPLTPNGKLDRKALPDPEVAIVSEGGGTRNWTPVQEIVGGIWRDVLGLPRVDLEDQFFDLGGHSLLATRVASRIRQTFDVDLPLRLLFEAPSLAALAGEVEAAVSLVRTGRALPLFVRAPRDRELPLSFAQQRLWFLQHLEPESTAFNIAEALLFRGDFRKEILAATVGEVVRRHEGLRTRFPLGAAGAIQEIEAPSPFRMPEIDLVALEEGWRRAVLSRLQAIEAGRRFDLEARPPFRSLVVKLGDREHAVLFTLHHIITDAWSMGVLVDEVTRIYADLLDRRAPTLKPLALQYVDFAHWQRSWLAEDVLAEQVSYWKRQLAGAPPLLKLSLDRPRPEMQTTVSDNVLRSLPREFARNLESLALREGVTLFMLLVSIFKVVLRHRARRDDIVIGTDVANRTRVETEGMIGFFVNQLPLRTDFSGLASFRDLLARVRETMLEAYAHQDLPFDRLVDALNPQRNLSYAPIFQVKLNLANVPGGALDLPGIELEVLPQERGAAQLDLIVNAEVTPEGVHLMAVFNSDLFGKDDVNQILDGVALVGDRLVNDVVVPLSQLEDTLTIAERDRRTADDKALRESRTARFGRLRSRSGA